MIIPRISAFPFNCGLRPFNRNDGPFLPLKLSVTSKRPAEDCNESIIFDSFEAYTTPEFLP